MNLQEFNQLAKQKGAKYFLSIGEDPTPMKRKFLIPLLKTFFHGKIKYENVQGIPSLLETIVKKENEEKNKINEKNICVTSGSTFGIYLSMFLGKENDELVLFSPYYPLYKELGEQRKFHVKIYDLSNHDFLLNEKAFLNAISEKTKICIINQPNNPTGRVYSEDELQKIIQIAEQRKILLLFDEVYDDIRYFSQEKRQWVPSNFVVRIKSFSKTYNMTGCRLAYILSSEENIQFLKKMQRLTLISVPGFIQEIGRRALKENKASHYKRYQKNRKIVLRFLKRNHLEFSPIEGTFYAFIAIKDSSLKMAVELIEKEHLVVLPGILFGKENYIRISFAGTKSNLKRCLKKMKPYLKKCNNV